MICKNCGAENGEDALLCARCGQPLEPPAETESAGPPPEERAPAEAELDRQSPDEGAGTPAEAELDRQAPDEEPGTPAEAEKAEKTPEPPPRKEPVWLLVLLGLIAVAAIIALIFALSGKSKKEAVPTEETSVSEPAAPAAPSAAPAGEAVEPASEPDAPDVDDAEVESYTRPDDEITDEMADAVAASCAGKELTNRELSYYYWNQFYNWANSYGAYLSYFIDPSKPLAAQEYDESRSWEDFLLEAALETFHQQCALVEQAERAGFEISEENVEYLELLPETLETNAGQMQLENADEFLRQLYGPVADVDSYTSFVRDSLISYGYLNNLFAEIDYTEEDVEAYYDENAETYASQGLSKDEPNLVDVRHILVKPAADEGAETDESGNPVLTVVNWAEAKKEAEDLLAGWRAGEADEEAFALLASENSEDPGSVGTGGLYEGVYPGEMVAAFNDWCFDETRQPGDTGIVETEYGYHIMFFSGRQDHAHWYEVAEQEYVAGLQQEILDGVTEGREMKVDYDKIVLTESKAM